MPPRHTTPPITALEIPRPIFPPVIFAGYGVDLEINDMNQNHPWSYPSFLNHARDGYIEESLVDRADPSYIPRPLPRRANHLTESLATLEIEIDSISPNFSFSFADWLVSYHLAEEELDLPSLQLLNETYYHTQDWLQPEHHALDQSNLPKTAPTHTLFSRIHGAYHAHAYLAPRDRFTMSYRRWYAEFNYLTQSPSREDAAIDFLNQTLSEPPEGLAMEAWVVMLQRLVHGELPPPIEHESRRKEWEYIYNTSGNERMRRAAGCKRKLRWEGFEEEERDWEQTWGRTKEEGEIIRGRCGATIAEYPRDMGTVIPAVRGSFFVGFLGGILGCGFGCWCSYRYLDGQPAREVCEIVYRLSGGYY